MAMTTIEIVIETLRWLLAPIWLPALLVGSFGLALAAMAMALLMPEAALNWLGDALFCRRCRLCSGIEH